MYKMRGFNSTLVRFKQGCRCYSQEVDNLFQFHSGSIQTILCFRLGASWKVVSIPLWFDSNFRQTLCRIWLQHVSIPLWFDSNVIDTTEDFVLSVFQFHSGSIQTNIDKLIICGPTRFQFHSGSIQTKDSDLYLVIQHTFQFHSGSIQTKKLKPQLPIQPRFQFHSGSIQTFADAFSMRFVESFNSTLVRFKRDSRGRIRQRWNSFNSTLVRFKHTTLAKEIINGAGFNSTLVRFKRDFGSPTLRANCSVSIPLWFDSNQTRNKRCAFGHQFQFHSGSIQTKFSFNELSFLELFQFHSGSIQTLMDLTDAVSIGVFQFHSGSIQTSPRELSVVCGKFSFQFHSGSIQTTTTTVSLFTIRGFNSTLVRFKPQFDAWISNREHRFNSTLVRFKPHSWSHRKRLIFVSIPLWFDSNVPVRPSASRHI